MKQAIVPLAGFACFNPRVRGGRDLRGPVGQPMAGRFNPRVRGGRDFPEIDVWVRPACFNPRVRGGRDADAKLPAYEQKVSIRASAGDAIPTPLPSPRS